MVWKTRRELDDKGRGMNGGKGSGKGQWLALQRKRDYRRERDNVERGHWELTEPLAPDKENELRELKNNDLWEEFTDPTTGNKEWRLKDPSQQPRHDELAYKDKENKGTTNYLETRLPPREYYTAKIL